MNEASKLLTQRDLKALDELLVRLQAQLDRQHPLHPGYEIIADARKVIDTQIQRSKR